MSKRGFAKLETYGFLGMHKGVCKFLVLSAVFWAAGLCLYAQDKPKTEPDDERIVVNTDLIDVPVVVTDGVGKLVKGLKASDFKVFEDGVEQEIAEFRTSTEPFDVALLLDTSGSTRSELNLIRRAASRFIASLRDGDRVGMIAFRTDTVAGRSKAAVDLLTAITGDRRALNQALDSVATSNGTPYYDALLGAAERLLKGGGENRRRVLVVLGDGVDSTSESVFQEVEDELLPLGIAVYFIRVDTRPFLEENLLGDCQFAMRFSVAQLRRYYSSLGARAERSMDFCKLGDFERLAVSKRLYELADEEMAKLAKATGGRVFPAADLTEAGAAFASIAEDIGTTYSLGYYSSNEKRDGKFRRIRVELKDKAGKFGVRAREGYTAPAN